MEQLLALPREDVNIYENMSPAEVMVAVSRRAEELNLGNPFTGTTCRADGLRARAGFWKAMCELNSVGAASIM